MPTPGAKGTGVMALFVPLSNKSQHELDTKTSYIRVRQPFHNIFDPYPVKSNPLTPPFLTAVDPPSVLS